MSSAVQGMPSVISDSELTTGFTKASPVVMPDKMPTTTLNLDLRGGGGEAEATAQPRQIRHTAQRRP